MDDLRLLKVLREVALRGSFSAAAASLSYSQPAVSQQIARLEAQTGVKLIERQPKGIKLTPAGEALVRHTEQILAQLAHAQAELTEIASDARGKLPDGSQLFSENSWRQLTMTVTPLAPGVPPPELEPLRANFRGYALGLATADYRGQKVLLHTGGLPGYVSRVMMFPDLELGIAVLTNQEAGEAFDAIAYRVADHFLQVPAHDWLAAYQAVQRRQAGAVDEADRKARTAPAPRSRSRRRQTARPWARCRCRSRGSQPTRRRSA